MQPINRSGDNSLQFNSNYTDVVNIESRIKENRLFLDDLKTDKQFQNLLIFMAKSAVPKERVLDFLTGKASLEACLVEKKWMTELLLKTYGGLEVRWQGSHFLAEPLTITLSTIFKQGYFESAEKSYSKMCALTGSIKRTDNSEKVDLAGAKLSGVLLYEADLSGANFSEASLTGANLSKADLSKADLTRANLFGADLYCTDLSGADLSGANLTKVDLSKANLAEASLFKANLSRAQLPGADLSGANLSGAFLYKVDLSKANLSGANLSGAHLSASGPSKIYLSGADLSGADLSKANLSEANLSEVNLSKANLSKANLTRGDLSGADLSGANLSEADLSGANLRSMKVKIDRLLNFKLIGAQSNNEDILALIKKQTIAEASKKYLLLSQIVEKFTFEGTPFPKELIHKIGRNLI